MWLKVPSGILRRTETKGYRTVSEVLYRIPITTAKLFCLIWSVSLVYTLTLSTLNKRNLCISKAQNCRKSELDEEIDWDNVNLFSMVLTLRDRAKSLVWVTTILFLGYSTTFFDGATSLQHQYHSYRTGIIRVKDGFGSTHTQGTGAIQGNEKVQSLNCERFRSVHRLFVTSESIYSG